MTLSERKPCNECKLVGQPISLFLKADPANNAEEECLSCGWRDEGQFFIDRISEIGFEQAKQEWEGARDCQLNKELEGEMNLLEKKQWEKYKKKVNEIFASQTYTERKYCNECQETTVHLKEYEEEEVEEACLPCEWKTNIEYWERERENNGIETAKKQWEEIRDGELNQQILLELTPEEKAKWAKLVKETNKLFVKEAPEQKETQSPFKGYLPYILGGIGIVALLALIIALATNKRRR